MQIIVYLASRMKEPSTWVSLGGLVTAIGWSIRPDLWQEIAAVGMGIGGLLGAALAEKSPTDQAKGNLG